MSELARDLSTLITQLYEQVEELTAKNIELEQKLAVRDCLLADYRKKSSVVPVVDAPRDADTYADIMTGTFSDEDYE